MSNMFQENTCIQIHYFFAFMEYDLTYRSYILKYSMFWDMDTHTHTHTYTRGAKKYTYILIDVI